MARILGIDPGSTVTGFAVVEAGALPRSIIIDCIRLPRAAFAVRLGLIFERLSEIIEQRVQSLLLKLNSELLSTLK